MFIFSFCQKKQLSSFVSSFSCMGCQTDKVVVQPLKRLFFCSHSHIIGSSLGFGLTMTLGTASIFSRHTRSGMFLLVPGLLTGRGANPESIFEILTFICKGPYVILSLNTLAATGQLLFVISTALNLRSLVFFR